MILYNIQHYGDWTYVPWLVRMLQHPNNQFLVTYDGSEEEVAQLREAIVDLSPDARRILVRRSIPIHWCGPSQARMLIDVLKEASGLEGWEYFVNLSGQCAPLQSQDFICSRLEHERHERGIEAHLFCFRVNRQIVLPDIEPQDDLEQRRIGRLNLLGPGVLLNHFEDPNFFPVKRVANRLILNCEEPDPSQKLLKISLPNKNEVKWKLGYLERNPHHAGRAWYMFSNRAVHALVDFFTSARSAEWSRLFLNCFQPDESFIQSALMNYDLVARERISQRSLRSFEGSPRKLNSRDYKDLCHDGTALFARKFSYEKSDLRNAVEECVS